MSSEYDLPKAVTQKLIRSKLPEGSFISNDARLAINKASSIFISYISSLANDICQENGRSTLVGKDVLEAMKVADLSDFNHELIQVAEVYQRETAEKKRNAKRKQETAKAMEVEEPEKMETAENENHINEPQSPILELGDS
eukprot:GCRY01003196.1.p1 GENE.GCRY01003196.1~~GCRY01003196.1.p1  ORF type:complete len:141 (+),score=20.45 GCRY01003196.1:243-665(+)